MWWCRWPPRRAGLSLQAGETAGSSMSVFRALFCVLVVCLSQIFTADALYFAREQDQVAIPFNYPSSQTFYEAFVLRSAAEHINSSITFHLEDTPIASRGIQASVSISSIFGVNQRSNGVLQSLQLFLRPAIEAVRSKLNDILVKVIVCAKHEGVAPHHSPCLMLKVQFLSSTTIASKNCNISALCFGFEPQFEFEVMENSEPQMVTRLGQPGFRRTCGVQNLSYEVQQLTGHKHQVVRVTNSDISTLEFTEALNREQFENINFRLMCTVGLDNQEQQQISRLNGSIIVRDENEHGPVAISRGPIIFEVENGVVKGLDRSIGISDDDPEPSPYVVEIVDDREQFFNITFQTEIMGNVIHKKFIIISLLQQMKDVIHFAGRNYTFKIRFLDTTLKVPGISPEALITVVLNKIVDSHYTDPSLLDEMAGATYNCTIYNTAGIYTRVLQPFSANITFLSGVKFFLKTMPGQQIFPSPISVTSRQGILYVNDTTLLSSANYSETNSVLLSLRLSWKVANPLTSQTSKKTGRPRYVTLNILIVENYENISMEYGQCVPNRHMCAMNREESGCLATCGDGAPESRCQWRNHTTYRKTPYATCSPDLRTCPDDVCDELEHTYFTVCPQDCVKSENILGSVVDEGSQSNGIHGASGTCTCDGQATCTCSETDSGMPHEEEEHIDGNKNKVNGKEVTGESANTSVVEMPVINAQNQETCDWRCITIIMAVTAAIVITVTVLAVCFWRKRKFNKLLAGRHKYPGSLASLPAVPSDYVDERSSSVVSQHVVAHNNEMMMIAHSNKFTPIDSKWEFSRNKLIMEQTLGEGEFGRVMKAKAMEINGQPGYSTVAVKMLKYNGLNSDMDLLSEFNLLKDVCHPNVIRLLGACSGKDGPLFIIVEYAEFGSLRSYLRKTRRLEFKSCTSDDSGVDSMANGCQADHPLSEYQVNPGDLLSFGWQIAKGMAYLSEMKLVHRDLAARNILVASGKVVKISDFGLTRDVYEGDTYMKKSLGRVPVKWMAIESLLDHVYTTKSDVWSFGIVLWEIVTLGAAPYPGVSPEMLFHLLKSGYRMEKPDNCSDELYKLMRRCWLESPYERPHFSELTKIFDDLLQANVEYLDLGLNMVQNLTYFEDTPALTDTIEADEGEESEMGYGSWNVLPTDDSDYLQTNPRSARDDEDAFLLEKVPGALSTLSASRSEICYVEEDTV